MYIVCKVRPSQGVITRPLGAQACDGPTKIVNVSNSFLFGNQDIIKQIDVADSYTLQQLVVDYGITPGISEEPGRFMSPLALNSYTNIPLGRGYVDYEDEVRYGTWKDFERRKKAGEIVLRPMFRVKARLHDTPSLVNARLQGVHSTLVALPPSYTIVRACRTSQAITYPALPPGVCTQLANSKLDAGYSEHYALVEYMKYSTSGATSFGSQGIPDLQTLCLSLRNLEIPPILKNEALDELYSGAYDILTELGELPETVKYLYDILRRIVLLAISVRSKEAIARKKFKGKELIDEITSLWMQFRYAASPLAYSLQDGLAYLDASAVEYQSARKRQDIAFSYTHGAYTFSGTAEQRVFGKIRMDATASTYNLGLNPLKTLWELTPLSFVVDWVLPVGQMLGSLISPSHSKQVAVMESTRVRSITVSSAAGVTPATFDFYYARPSTTIPNFAYPDVFLNWKRVLDALALSWGLFLKQHWKS